MPNDAKFGLVIGVGLVIAVAVVFFRKEAPAPPAEAVPSSTATVISGETKGVVSGEW